MGMFVAEVFVSFPSFGLVLSTHIVLLREPSCILPPFPLLFWISLYRRSVRAKFSSLRIWYWKCLLTSCRFSRSPASTCTMSPSK